MVEGRWEGVEGESGMGIGIWLDGSLHKNQAVLERISWPIFTITNGLGEAYQVTNSISPSSFTKPISRYRTKFRINV